MLSDILAPDHTQFDHYEDGNIEIAARRRPQDPLIFDDDRVVVSLEGQLDSSEGLCERLGIAATPLNPGKIIAESYKTWGDDIVEHVSGEVGYLIWDKETRTLFCARDRYGRVPFYYMTTPSEFVISTEFASIASSGKARLQINDAWVVEYINGVVADQDGTPLKQIKRLAPGCCLKWYNHELEIRRYWSVSKILPTRQDIAPDKIFQTLSAAVNKRTLDQNCVTMLSGGLDSSSLAVLARDARMMQNTLPQPTISLVFDEHARDSEKPFIQAVLDQGGFESHIVDIESFDVFRGIERLVQVHGMPTVALGALISDQAAAKAEQLGFTSVLLGHGGDEVISGFGKMRLFELAREGRWMTLFIELIKVSKNSELVPIRNIVGLFGAYGKGISAKVVRKAHSIIWKSHKERSRPKLIGQDWKDHPSIIRSEKNTRAFHPSQYTNEREYHESILSMPLQSVAIEFLSRQYRSRGIRAEFPFWDEKLVDYCLRVPSHQKLANGVPRSLMRSVMSAHLPKLVLHRFSKYNFSESLIAGLQSNVAQMRQLARDSEHKVFGYVDQTVFSSSISDLSHASPYVRAIASKNVWTTLNLAIWLDHIANYNNDGKDLMDLQ